MSLVKGTAKTTAVNRKGREERKGKSGEQTRSEGIGIREQGLGMRE